MTASKRPAEQPRRRQLPRRPRVEALARAIDKTGPIDTLGHYLAQATRENA